MKGVYVDDDKPELRLVFIEVFTVDIWEVSTKKEHNIWALLTTQCYIFRNVIVYTPREFGWNKTTVNVPIGIC